MPESDFPGILHPSIGGIGVSDISFVSGFDTDPDKVGLDLADAIHKGRNNYPRLVDVPALDVIVEQGLTNLPSEGDIESLAESLRETRAEVLLYSLPTGLQWAADAYADQHDLKAVAAAPGNLDQLSLPLPSTFLMQWPWRPRWLLQLATHDLCEHS